MLKVKFYSRLKGSEGEAWPEEASVTSLETAEEEIKEIVKKFNQVEKERYGDKGRPREFIRLAGDSKGKPQHEWHKIGIYHGARVPYRCSNCRKEVIYSFPDVPYGGDCYPERVCQYCKKEFKNEANRIRHEIRMHK